MFCNADDTDVQGQEDTIAFTLILVYRRKSGMPRADCILGGFVAEMVRHTSSPRMAELKRLPVRRPPRKESLSSNRRTDQHRLDSQAILSGIHCYDNQVKNGVWREQFP